MLGLRNKNKINKIKFFLAHIGFVVSNPRSTLKGKVQREMKFVNYIYFTYYDNCTKIKFSTILKKLIQILYSSKILLTSKLIEYKRKQI